VTKKLIFSLPGLAGCLPLLYLGGSAVVGALGSAENGNRWLLLFFAAATAVYGISGLVLIGVAWCRPGPQLHLVAAALGVFVVLVWIVGSLDYGSLSGLDWASVIALALLAFFVWFSVRLLSG